jgi:tetratricopeptide (TPR) repeat protein
MEPARNDTWYFIHNNLGYSYNQIGRFAEGENCCRRAIQINPARPNGHKNLGIALAAQGKYREAALCYITGTFNHAGDGRSFTLLKELVKEHPELGFDFQKQIDRCEKLVNFAVLAIGRARAGQPMKVLLGLGKSEWLNLCGHTLKAISGGAVAIQVAENLSQFTEIAGGKNFELGFLAPGILPTGPTDIEATVSWERAILTVSQIKAQQPMAIILVGTKADGARHQADCKASGVAAVLEANNQTDALVEATIHLLTPS